MAHPVPQTDFTLAGDLFEIQQAGSLEDVLLTFYIGETNVGRSSA